MEITRTSVITGIRNTRQIAIEPEHYAEWALNGVNLRQIASYLNADEIAFIETGEMPDEWHQAVNDVLQQME